MKGLDRVSYIPDLTRQRVEFLNNNFNDYFINSQTVVNMGAHVGDISFLICENINKDLSFLNEEGREYIHSEGKGKYNTQFNWLNIDYEKCNLSGLKAADIVINFGLLYHISPEKAFELVQQSVKRTKKIMFLETEVLDCDNEICYLTHDGSPQKRDKAMVGLEIRPSISWVENALKVEGYRFERLENTGIYNHDGNGKNFIYDWKPQNTKLYNSYLRKFWAIYKE